MSEAEGSRLADEAGGFLEEIDGVGQCIGTDAQEIPPVPFRRERSERNPQQKGTAFLIKNSEY